jgi:hypothetical protein
MLYCNMAGVEIHIDQGAQGSQIATNWHAEGHESNAQKMSRD